MGMDIGAMSGFDSKQKRKNMSNWHVLSCSYGSCVSFKVLGKRCEVKSVSRESYLFALLQAFPIRKIRHSISSLNVFPWLFFSWTVTL